MDEVNFYVDELPILASLSKLEECAPGVEQIVSIIEEVLDTGIGSLYCYSDLYSLEVGGQQVAQIIFAGNHDGKIRDLLLRLQLVHARTNACNTDTGLGFGRSAINAATYGALITGPDFPPVGWWNPDSMLLISQISDISYALRRFFVLLKLQPEGLPLYARSMFGNVYFHVSACKVKDLGLDFDEHRSAIIGHLSYLNDHAAHDFANFVQPHEIIANAGSRGVEISPESSKTHANKDAMNERDITIGGKCIRCEWHTKLGKQVGRIHFYARTHPEKSVTEIVGNKVIVGIITDHLTV